MSTMEDFRVRLDNIVFQKILDSENCVEPSGVQALKNPNALKDVEALAELVVVVLF